MVCVTTSETKTYYWDFFGATSTETAAHFLEHLQQFLLRHEVEACSLDTCSGGEGHRAVRCVAPAEAQQLIERALRPKRSE